MSVLFLRGLAVVAPEGNHGESTPTPTPPWTPHPRPASAATCSARMRRSSCRRPAAAAQPVDCRVPPHAACGSGGSHRSIRCLLRPELRNRGTGDEPACSLSLHWGACRCCVLHLRFPHIIRPWLLSPYRSRSSRPLPYFRHFRAWQAAVASQPRDQRFLSFISSKAF